jgi:hypothetical protein
MSHDSFSISFALTVLAVLFAKLSIVGSPKVSYPPPPGPLLCGGRRMSTFQNLRIVCMNREFISFEVEVLNVHVQSLSNMQSYYTCWLIILHNWE